MVKIVIGGCSFSDPNYISRIEKDYDTSFKKWFEYLDGDVVSVAKSGINNGEMINRVIDHIMFNDTDVAIVALTDWMRFNIINLRFSADIMLKRTYDPFWEKYIDPALIKIADEMLGRFDLPKHVLTIEIVKYCITLTYRQIITLSEICKSKNIDLHIFQMIDLNVLREIDKEFNDTLLGHRYFEYLWENESANIIGFPFIRSAGGIIVDDFIPRQGRISESDHHPNELGHKIIAEWVNEKIKIT